jgi:hypothetical protein
MRLKKSYGMHNKSYISETEYVSFAFDKNKRVNYIKELIEMFKLPISGWNVLIVKWLDKK